MYIEQATTHLRDCEQALRTLLAKAAAGGDYDNVMRLTTWARAIGDLLDGADVHQSSRALASRSESHAGEIEPPQIRPVSPRSHSAGRKRTAVDQYPKFHRQANDLIKTGWSRREKKEYTHKAPRSAVDLLTTAIASVGTGGKVFTTDRLLPLIDPSDKSQLPEYQVYVGLAWLRHAGIIIQHGRQGYTLARNGHVPDLVEARWKSLEERKA